jgi:hypothetical protein
MRYLKLSALFGILGALIYAAPAFITGPYYALLVLGDRQQYESLKALHAAYDKCHEIDEDKAWDTCIEREKSIAMRGPAGRGR